MTITARTKAEEEVRDDGFAFMEGAAFRKLVSPSPGFEAFAESWARMPLDPYLAREGIERRRRHGVFRAAGGAVERLADRPHFQATKYNALQGGFARRLAPIEDDVGRSALLVDLIAAGSEFFGALARSKEPWDVEAHQFRIEAGATMGIPTPEGAHRDGVDFVLVVMIRRENLESGTTYAFDESGVELGSFTLTHPFDAALVDDRRVLHGVTPVTPKDPTKAAFRDVLVLTYRHTARHLDTEDTL